jgi:hypothetical protein
MEQFALLVHFGKQSSLPPLSSRQAMLVGQVASEVQFSVHHDPLQMFEVHPEFSVQAPPSAALQLPQAPHPVPALLHV